MKWCTITQDIYRYERHACSEYVDLRKLYNQIPRIVKGPTSSEFTNSVTHNVQTSNHYYDSGMSTQCLLYGITSHSSNYVCSCLSPSKRGLGTRPPVLSLPSREGLGIVMRLVSSPFHLGTRLLQQSCSLPKR